MTRVGTWIIKLSIKLSKTISVEKRLLSNGYDKLSPFKGDAQSTSMKIFLKKPAASIMHDSLV